MPPIRVHRAAVVPADALVPRLAPRERERLDRAAPADRDAVASVLLLVRLAVAERCGVAPDQVRVRRRCPRCGSAAHGVPVAYRADGGSVPHVSLSRARRLVVVALSDAGPVGVDIEKTHPDPGPARTDVEHAHPNTRPARAGVVQAHPDPPPACTDVDHAHPNPRAAHPDPGPARTGDRLARVVLAPGEPPAAGPHGLLRTWARTEAVLKAAGTGLAVDPRALRVSDAAGRPEVRVVDPAAARPLAVPPGTRWWLTDLDAGPDHVAALAAPLPWPSEVDDRTTTLA